ncbi:MAG TPA: hypothetical protein VEY67_02070, partial [Candidatus Dormibacteraeota bacterium]|nr:hypothetical protein [Candidatus Dormibacteraeota bacterium]
PAGPLLDRRTTLKDALSFLLDHDVQAGIVVDRRGVYRGGVTVDSIAEWVRASTDETADRRVTDEPGDEASPAAEAVAG